MSGSTALSLLMTEPWQLIATWGVLSGLGSGAVATVLGATIVNRWFKTNRGLMMGLMSASAATGLLVFLPRAGGAGRAWRLAAGGDRASRWPPRRCCRWSICWCPSGPSSIGLCALRRRRGRSPTPRPRRRQFPDADAATLRRPPRTRVFWYLFATFFICGFTTNGLVGTHLIAFCGDMGIPRGAGGRPAGADGRVRPDRHHAVGLADRPLRPAQAARRLLRPARPVADLPAAIPASRRPA